MNRNFPERLLGGKSVAGEGANRVKTEILFLERCIDLLKPGGRLGIVLPEGILNNPSLTHVREFVEDRTRLLAVVSLPQETFLSSGASVKASILFVEKFNQATKKKFDRLKREARAEAENRHSRELEAERHRLSSMVAQAKERRHSTEVRREAQRASVEFERQIELKIKEEARQLLKMKFDYPIFLYDAQYVGISATGEADYNELCPGDALPPNIEESALDQFRRFEKDPTPFFA